MGFSKCWCTCRICRFGATYCDFDWYLIDRITNSPAMEGQLEALYVIGYIGVDRKYRGCNALGNMGVESNRRMDSAKHWRTNWNARWIDLFPCDEGLSPGTASNTSRERIY